jgi:hypothetical protein
VGYNPYIVRGSWENLGNEDLGDISDTSISSYSVVLYQEENYVGFVALVSAVGFVVLFLLMPAYSDF